MNTKKIFTTLLIAVMLLAPFQAVHAQGSNPPTPTLASLIQEYGLKPVSYPRRSRPPPI